MLQALLSCSSFIALQSDQMWEDHPTLQTFSSLRSKIFLSDEMQQKNSRREKKQTKGHESFTNIHPFGDLSESRNFGEKHRRSSFAYQPKSDIKHPRKGSFQQITQISGSAKIKKSIEEGSKNFMQSKDKMNAEEETQKGKGKLKALRKGSLNFFPGKGKLFDSCEKLILQNNEFSDISSENDEEFEGNQKKPNKNIEIWNNNIVLQDFVKLKKIGEGAFGAVYLVKHGKTGTIYALKIIAKDPLKKEKCEENLLREIQIQGSLNDSHLLKLYGVFEDEKNIYLIMEPMLDGSLWGIKKKFYSLKQKHVSSLVLNLCEGVKELHLKDILHRDIKLQNILLMEGVAKLADFGCAVKSMFMRKSQIGSRNYLSPQQFHSRYYNKKIDIWSIGIVTYELLYGIAPFQEQLINNLKNMEELPSFELKFPEQTQVSHEAKNFMRKLLQKNPTKRIDIETALSQPFLKKVPVIKSAQQF